jgi:hypothetical protein
MVGCGPAFKSHIHQPVCRHNPQMCLLPNITGLDPAVYRGWCLAIAIGASGFSMAVLHHRSEPCVQAGES